MCSPFLEDIGVSGRCGRELWDTPDAKYFVETGDLGVPWEESFQPIADTAVEFFEVKHRGVREIVRANWSSASFFLLIGAGYAVIPLGTETRPHGDEARFVKRIPWTAERVPSVFGLYTSEIGLARSDSAPNVGDTVTVAGRPCMLIGLAGIDIEDHYAFDIDESVELAVTYVPERTTMDAIRVAWDRNGGEGRGFIRIEPEDGALFRTATVTLDRARMAGQGARGVDIALGNSRGEAVICDLRVRRSGTTAAPSPLGFVRLEVTDADSGRPVPARVGLYDATGRLPLPSDDALMVHRFADHVRRLWVSRRDTWPSENRQVFYVDGSYEGRVPAGTYEVVVTRGPEYRVHRGTVDVSAEGRARVAVALERYTDLPSQGWISGDTHIHLPRDRVDEAAVQIQVAAEDVHVGIILQMGNISEVHFSQPAFGELGRYEKDGYVVVSGQEDPRTGHRGHTMHFNLDRPIRQTPSSYFLYHEVFEESQRQGGVSGYAHLAPWFNPRRGLALDVPFALVDFLEVLQYGRLNTDIWYDFLNLGFRLVPAAGSDYPYLDLPGAVRQYVKIEGPATPEAWFEAFKAGSTYVTSGPFLELSVGDRSMGEEMEVEAGTRVEVIAEARLNPDVDRLDRLELVVLGEVVATELARGRDRITLRTQITVSESLWLAARAYGAQESRNGMTVAHTTPVYVVVDGLPTWNADAVPQLVARYQGELREMMETPIDPEEDLEPWETRELLLVHWEHQRELLRERVEEAHDRLQNILIRAGR